MSSSLRSPCSICFPQECCPFLTLVESLRLTCRRLSLVLSFLFMQDSFIGSADLSHESLSFTTSSSVSYPLFNMI